MEKDSKLTGLIVILLVLVCFGILGYMVYLKTNQKAKPEEKKDNVEPQGEIVEEPKEEDNGTEATNNEKVDDLVKELYAIIGGNPEFRYEDSVTYEDLSENVRDSIVMNYIDGECKETNTYDKEYYLLKYKEVFNEEKTDPDGFCKLNGSSYECARYCSEFGPLVFYKFTKYEKEDDAIIIYETAGHFDYSDDGKIYLKENASDELAIASFDTLEEFENSQVGYKLPTYKHTFEQVDGKYYWVSSEFVKQ